MELPKIIAEMFPGLAAMALAVGGWLWAKNIKRRAHGEHIHPAE
ncbi:hypothetical protein GCM10007897_36040 [Sphingobium jiangsuense]|uniref:Uncharacterized protein n=1 Tax=Sphingobium jiangsuense TaxID=870476 RepID=A0A7W6BMU1_9SPHN|nr:hypothetical protein [Sphingobium jiangsuense]MBB3928744.1 hypothetical protein [Sphingobium jiangsuense]GLT02199.1 hypothetical protein GCM10007897_36040 [Sphingobium jiangsuense]